MNGPWNTKSRFVGDVHALSFHGSPARVTLLLQAARGRHAQLQARGVDDLGPGAIQAEIPFERVDDVVERRRLARGLAPGLGLHHRRFRDDLALQHHALGDGFALGQDGSF